MPHPLRHAAAVLLAMSALACGGDHSITAPQLGDASGNWRGTGRGVDMELRLEQHEGKVTGSGSMTTNQQFTVSASGFNDPGGLSVTLTSQAHGDMTVIGPYAEGGTLHAILIGNGFYAEPVTLQRH
jgi:hypothetical protein